MEPHKPVLLKESIEYLVTEKSGKYFDGTLGFGGHSGEILKNLSEQGILAATDKDIIAFKHCEEKFSGEDKIKIYHAGFINIDTIAKIEFIEGFDGIFADLGVSSFQLDDENSGFSYRFDAPLDMRMDKSKGISAADVLNEFEEKEIADIIYKYGEEKKSRVIAKKVVEARLKNSFKTTGQLKDIVERIIPGKHAVSSLSRVFQALRIFVNNELDELKLFLEKSVPLLKKGGRIVILSYHSLEDRIVKDTFKDFSRNYMQNPENPFKVIDLNPVLKILTNKPVTPADSEITINKRARSAKLRAAEKI